MMSKIVLLMFVVFLSLKQSAQTYGASNFTLIGLSDPETTFNPDSQKYSGCWGWYQAAKNKEYAIACSHKGTYWIDITSPATPSVSAYRAGAKSGCIWREAKSYKNYLYVISDDFGSNTFQIFDMQYLPDSVHKVYDSQALFSRGHTLYIDQDKLYIASATKGGNFSSMQVYSLANPASPVIIRRLENDYPSINHVHDMFVRNDTIYASCGNQGLYVYKLMANNTFSLLGSLTNYPSSGYNHSSALTPDGQTLVFMDEVPSGLPVKVANVNNLSNIQVLATVNQYSNTTPHNPFIVNNQYCFVSSYQDGLQLYDISNPSAPLLAGYFDTHPQSGGNNNLWPSNGDYNGQWGAYPYFPSGTIFALDRLNGGFILKTNLYQAPPVYSSFVMQDTICPGINVNLTNTSSGANSFTWNFPAGTTGSQTLPNATLSFTSTGVYTINLIAANATFSSSYTHTVTVVDIGATISATNASCSNCNDGIIVVNPVNGQSPFYYTWNPPSANSATFSSASPGCYTVNITDAQGCTTKTNTCVSFKSTLGLPDLNINVELVVYPNPGSNHIHIFSDDTKDLILEIKNSLGEMIFQKEIKGIVNEYMDTHELASGMYFISIRKDGLMETKKLIIRH